MAEIKGVLNIAKLLCNGKKNKDISEVGFNDVWQLSKIRLAEEAFNSSKNEDGDVDMRNAAIILVNRLTIDDSAEKILEDLGKSQEYKQHTREKVADCLLSKYIRKTYLDWDLKK